MTTVTQVLIYIGFIIWFYVGFIIGKNKNK